MGLLNACATCKDLTPGSIISANQKQGQRFIRIAEHTSLRFSATTACWLAFLLCRSFCCMR